MIWGLVLPVVVGAVVCGWLARRHPDGIGPLPAAPMGGVLAGVLALIVVAAVWFPLFGSWPKQSNQLGRGDFVSSVPGLVFWGWMGACGPLAGKLASWLISGPSSKYRDRIVAPIGFLTLLLGFPLGLVIGGLHDLWLAARGEERGGDVAMGDSIGCCFLSGLITVAALTAVAWYWLFR